MAASTVIFYYDVVCPFAYTASRRIDAVVQAVGGKVHWRPVLLGGLYKVTEAPQGKDGSAMDVMAPAKMERISEDLRRQMYRAGISDASPVKHPQRTLHAMRILAGIEDQQKRIALSKAFFKAYWHDGYNLEETESLQTVIDQTLGISGLNAGEMARSSADKLKSNTEEAGSHGAFGVPSFYVGGKLFWGADRLFMVERMLGKKDALQDRIMSPPKKSGSGAVLTFFFDYSSPWSYLGHQQLQRTIDSVSPVAVTVEYVPMLLGALFKAIGTPNLPAQAMAFAKQQYYSFELDYWSKEVAGVELRWPDNFPIRTVLPLRVTLASGCNPDLIQLLYTAAWRDNIDIGDPSALSKLLNNNGFNSDRLLEEASTQPIKKMLFINNERAVHAGVCGAPSFQVNQGQVIWGQDRLNIVADMLCGWDYPPSATNNSKL